VYWLTLRYREQAHSYNGFGVGQGSGGVAQSLWERACSR